MREICAHKDCEKLLRKDSRNGRCWMHQEDNPQYMRDWREKNAERISAGKKVRSGLTSAEAKARREAAGACEICGGATDVVDHNHQTLVVRGVLCHFCNTRLGMIERPDHAEWLVRALAYLKKYPG